MTGVQTCALPISNINRRKGFFGINKNINPGNNFANVEGTIPHAMLFDMKNPDFGDFSIIPPVVAKDETKDSAIIKQRGGINYYSVFEPEQIHILLSKADIQGFKEFIQEEKDDLKPFIDESNKVGEQIRDVEDNIQFSLSPEINYQLKAIEILNSDKAKQVFDKGRKNNWTLNKVLDGANIAKSARSGKVLLNGLSFDTRFSGNTDSFSLTGANFKFSNYIKKGEYY